MLTIQDILTRATLDVDQIDYLYNNVLTAWDNGNHNLIRIVESPMNSGKTTTILMATAWAEVYRNPSRNLILYVAPRKELIKDAIKKVEANFDDKNLLCSDNTVKNISVYDQDTFNSYIKLNKISAKQSFTIPSTDIIFAAVSIQWLTDSINLANVSKINSGLVYSDEPHIGLKIADASSMIEDAGRRPSIWFDPVWLPAMLSLAAKGHKVLGSTATTSASQSGVTDSGKTKFQPLPVMPKRDFKTCFPVLHPNHDVYSVYDDFKDFWPKHLKKTKELINSISVDTWSKAAAINVVPCMPLYLIKGGAENAQRSIPFFVRIAQFQNDTLYNNLWNFHRGLNSDSIFAINTSNFIELEKKGNVNYMRQNVKDLNDIMEVLNDPANNMYDGGLGVINTGTAGMNVHRFDTVVYLSDPQNLSDVADSQVQTFGRIMRFPFVGMRSHADMRDKINNLDISLTEKYLLCQYVVYKCLNHVFYVDAHLMNVAVDEFCEVTMTQEGGLAYYISHMTSGSSHHAAPAPTLGMQYNASALNATYKMHHCQVCLNAGSIDVATGKTLCEVSARKVREFERGHAFSDIEWDDTWFHSLVLDHKNCIRTDYSPGNLVTRCSTNNAVKTYDCKDFLARYDANGNRI